MRPRLLSALSVTLLLALALAAAPVAAQNDNASQNSRQNTNQPANPSPNQGSNNPNANQNSNNPNANQNSNNPNANQNANNPNVNQNSNSQNANNANPGRNANPHVVPINNLDNQSSQGGNNNSNSGSHVGASNNQNNSNANNNASNENNNSNHISATGAYIQLSVSQSNVRETGSVMHYDFTETDLLIGTVSGLLTVEGQCMVRESGEGRCHARGEFVGTAAGQSGTLEFVHNFDVNLTNMTLGDGHFTLQHGTGGLEDLHGQGSFGGSIFAGEYSGKLHFAPNGND